MFIGPLHEIRHGLPGIGAAIQDVVEFFGNGHFDAKLPREFVAGLRGLIAFHHHAHFLDGGVGIRALADEVAEAPIAAVHAGASDD